MDHIVFLSLVLEGYLKKISILTVPVYRPCLWDFLNLWNKVCIYSMVNRELLKAFKCGHNIIMVI